MDGPASECPNSVIEYYIDGIKYEEEEYNKIIKYAKSTIRIDVLEKMFINNELRLIDHIMMAAKFYNNKKLIEKIDNFKLLKKLENSL